MGKKKKIEIYKVVVAIYEELIDSKLDTTVIKSLSNEIGQLSKYLKVGDKASLLFSIIYSLVLENGDVSVRRLARLLDLKLSALYDLKDAFEELLTKNLIEILDEEDFFFQRQYGIPDIILDGILENKELKDITPKEEITIFQFLTFIYPEFVSRSLKQYTLLEFVKAISRIEDRHSNIKIPIKLKKLGLSTDERAFLYVIAQHQVLDNEGCNLSKMLKEFYDEGYYNQKLKGFISETTILIKEDLIKIPSQGFADKITVSLTENGKALIFEEEAKLVKNKKQSQFMNLIEPHTIRHKELFFNPDLKAQLEFFKKSISPDNLKKIHETAKINNFSANFVAAFFGPSGVGKTQYVKVLAHSTGFPCYWIDYTKTKSEYYSASQKLIKQLFNDIKNVCRESENPIIFMFNEADSMFHKRKDGGGLNDAIMQVENEIQNILLEEFEDIPMNAIYILATNRMDAFDSALYRRILFKINFTAPDDSVMKQIIKNKINHLTDDQIEELVNKSQIAGGLNGGQIENIAVKIAINQVVNNKTPSVDEILAFCQSENKTNIFRPKIGFT